MGMAAFFHVPPWEIEQGLTLEWLWRWRAWNEEQPASKQANKK